VTLPPRCLADGLVTLPQGDTFATQ